MTEKEIYDYLNEKWEKYTLSRDKDERDFIEDCVRSFVNFNVSESLYKEFDVNNTGDVLFGPGFFEIDLKRALIVLQNRLAL